MRKNGPPRQDRHQRDLHGSTFSSSSSTEPQQANRSSIKVKEGWLIICDGDQGCERETPIALFDFGSAKAPPDFKPHLALTVKLDEGPPGSLIQALSVTKLLSFAGWTIADLINLKFLDFFEDEWIAYGGPGGRLTPDDLARGMGGRKFPRFPGVSDPPKRTGVENPSTEKG